MTFVESSQALGVAEAILETWGLATVDWNADGCDDLYVGRHGLQFPHLYRNGCPGAFAEKTNLLHLDQLPWKRTHDRHTPNFGDYDADGLMDLFIVTGGGSGRTPGEDDQLFHQLPAGDFEEVAAGLGMTDRLQSGRHTIWFDYDGDGDLDLFVGHFPQVERVKAPGYNVLWRQRQGTFNDAARRAGVKVIERSHEGVATDLDQDGDMDLLLAPGEDVTLYVNQGDGTFTRTLLGIGKAAAVVPGDYDNDGDQDLFYTRGRAPSDTAESRLYRNDGGTWTKVNGANVQYPNTLTPLWLDVDNDGDLDLYVTRNIDGSGINQPNLLLLNDGAGEFVDDAAAAGVVGPTDGALDSAAWADFNRDGFLDLAVLISGSQTAVQIYLNQGNSNHWLTVRLRDPNGKNRNGIGAKVWATMGSRTLYRELTSSQSRESQSALYIHFGLGTATVVDTLRVRWPDGTQQTFTDVPADTHYEAVKGGALLRR